jgi:hypothetical protein
MTEEEIRSWEAEEDEADAGVLRRYGGDPGSTAAARQSVAGGRGVL